MLWSSFKLARRVPSQDEQLARANSLEFFSAVVGGVAGVLHCAGHFLPSWSGHVLFEGHVSSRFDWKVYSWLVNHLLTHELLLILVVVGLLLVILHLEGLLLLPHWLHHTRWREVAKWLLLLLVLEHELLVLLHVIRVVHARHHIIIHVLSR